jgi:hypothetical protein
MEQYKRKSIFSELKGFCSFATKDEFMEVTEWKNMEGFDVVIHSVDGNFRFKMTHGEFGLLKKLIKKLDDK